MSTFNIQKKRVNDFNILEIQGELDAHTAPQLENVLQELIQDQKLKIIVNCQQLDYIASAGLGVFMAYIEDVRSMGGDIKLTNMKPKVYNVFDLLGFPTLYDILKDEHEAISNFSNKS